MGGGGREARGHCEGAGGRGQEAGAGRMDVCARAHLDLACPRHPRTWGFSRRFEMFSAFVLLFKSGNVFPNSRFVNRQMAGIGSEASGLSL